VRARARLVNFTRTEGLCSIAKGTFTTEMPNGILRSTSDRLDSI
jgi:hypothetical protein